jgi:hypothetical protein
MLGFIAVCNGEVVSVHKMEAYGKAELYKLAETRYTCYPTGSHITIHNMLTRILQLKGLGTVYF